MGPQHPSTHGVLRVILKLDGEVIIDCDPVIGYLHRGVEKLGESHRYAQVIPWTDRTDYVAAPMNNLGCVMAFEKLCDVEAPERAQYWRVIMAELARIASHLVWLGTHALDIGALSMSLYCFRERETDSRHLRNVLWRALDDQHDGDRRFLAPDSGWHAPVIRDFPRSSRTASRNT